MVDEMKRLLGIMKQLRGKSEGDTQGQGCAWDKEQTHGSLVQYAVEEVYELVEAIESGEQKDLVSELGDVLLQVVFHAQIADEDGRFDFADVARSVSDKMVRRHPHIFDDAKFDGQVAMKKNWEKLKAEEHPDRQSIVDGVSATLPALMRAAKIQTKAGRVGFEWPDVTGAREKVTEELCEFDEVIGQAEGDGGADQDRIEDELGDVLFAMVNVARYVKVDPEAALRRTIRKFDQRFRFVESALAKSGKSCESSSLEEMDALWNEAKTQV